MQIPSIPANETARLGALRSLQILDTEAEERFDRVTRLARRLFDVPIVLVSLVDENRQWFKSCQGLAASETPRDISFCGHAINQSDVLVVPDAAADPRFSDNPLVTGDPFIRFYAGYPLKLDGGFNLGTLCLIDRRPREFSNDDLESLRDLGQMVEQEFTALEMATIDALTGLSNRRGFDALATHALGMCARLARPAAVLYIDLDDFKPINDQFGHAEGDGALRRFSGVLLDTFRGSDVVARLGGDEFVVLLTNADGHEIRTALERLRTGIDVENAAAKRGYKLAYSTGIARYDASRHADIQALLADADSLMYQDKAERRAHKGRAPMLRAVGGTEL
ncbi:MAG: sensor domain-containing diguanylate cyclase [Pseudomonadota bacterium]